MITKKTIKIFFIVFLLFYVFVSPLKAETEFLNHDNYFIKLDSLIKNSQHSVLVSMPVISWEEKNSDVLKILRTLAHAKNRGVDVSVYLDYSSVKDIIQGGSLYRAVDFLKKAKINTFFDYPSAHINNRIVIIDKEIILGGSIVWSDSIKNNFETVFLVHSTAKAKTLFQEIVSIPTISDPFQERNENFAYIPASFFKRSGALRKMLDKNDEKSLDVYLSLIRDFDGKIVDTDFKKLAESSGISKRIKRKMRRRKITRLLKKLEKTYNVIEISNKNKKVTIKIMKNPGESEIWMPKTYWEYGWNKSLPFHAKIMLLLNYNEISFRKKVYDWKSARTGICDKYKISYWTVNNGILELCRNNIMDLRYVEPNLKDEKQSIISFHYNELYDKNEFYVKYKALEGKYGRKITITARNYAAIIYKKFDISSIDYLIGLLRISGETSVKNIFGLILKTKPISSERTLVYLRRVFKD